MRRRGREQQAELFVTADRLPKSEGHVFYRKLNGLLGEAGFDTFVEGLCEPCYADPSRGGRPSVPPGVYFRMLVVGYFEGIGSQRGIAWRCADSLSLRGFLGVPLTESTPDHSSLTRIRDRLSIEIHTRVFQFVLALAKEQGLLKGKTVAVDSTTLEADAAMKSIVRRDSGEDWKEYLRRLMQEEGLSEEDDEPSDEDLRRFDKQRKNKRVSNEEWFSPTDPDARIAKLKDGRTHLAYKAEHVVDIDTELILAAEVYHADHSDQQTLADSVMEAVENTKQAKSDQEIEEVVADKGHSQKTQALGRAVGVGQFTQLPHLHPGAETTGQVAAEREALRAAAGGEGQPSKNEDRQEQAAAAIAIGAGRTIVRPRL
ncbi:transposase [Botrimarina hoheduenensis]|nr:transposase [Botrimarina hoheduenensis]